MAPQRRASPRRKAAIKRRARRRAARQKWIKKRLKARWQRMVKATRARREAKRKAQPPPITRKGTTAISKSPSWFATRWAATVAYFRAQNIADRHNGAADVATGKANRFGRRRVERRHTFVCYGHIDPLRFATAAELSAHLEHGHPEQVRHRRGKESPPIRNVTPRNRPPRRPRGGRPRTKDRTRPGSGNRGTAAANKWAGEAMATLDEIGSARIRSVSQIKELMAGLEKVALQLEEAVTGFQRNASTSEEAPVDAGVLAQLDSAKEGAETVAAAVVGFLSAFDEYYAEDIREAQAGERMENQALTS